MPDPRTQRCGGARLSRLLLPALALLLGTFGLLGAAPAAAQSVWSATLTVQDLGGTGVFQSLGCSDSVTGKECSTTSVLTDDDFSVGGDDVSITYIRYFPNSGPGNITLGFSASNDALKALSICVGPVASSLSGIATTPGGTIQAITIRPSVSAWSAGDKVPLSIGSACHPGAPTGLDAAAGNQKLDLSWTAPSANGGSAITGYDVHYTSAPKTGQGAVGDDDAASGNDPSAAWVAVSRTEADPPAASQAITSLTNGTTYRVRVRAKNAAGSSPWARDTGTPAASNDATLSALTGNTSTDNSDFSATLTLSPAFDSATESYTATVANAVTHVKLTPTVNESNATVKAGKGATLTPVTSGEPSAAIALEVGENALKVEVTAQDTSTTKTYTVTVTRRQSNDATLSALTGNTSTDNSDFSATLTLSPAFASDTERYTATVANAVTHVKLTPTVNESNATVKVGKGTDLTTVPSGEPSAAIALAGGVNALKVEVTAQDGTKNTYTVAVNRTVEPPDAPADLNITPGNARLDLAWTAPAYDGASAVIGYDVHYTLVGSLAVPDDDPDVKASPNVGWAVAVSRTGSTSRTLSSLINGNNYRLRVRAKNAAGNGPWRHGQGTPQDTASGDATLRALAGSTSTDGSAFSGMLTLSPAFDSATTGYTATVASSVTHVKLTPTANDANHRRVQVRKGAGPWATVTSGSASDAFALDAGENTFSISVDAENGSTDTYTVTITRRSPAGAPTNLRVTSGDRKLDLAWTAPAGVTVTGYDVHYTSSTTVGSDAPAGTNPATAWVAVSRSGSAASQAITGLTNGTAYRLRVRVQGGTGGWLHGSGTPRDRGEGVPLVQWTRSSVTVRETNTDWRLVLAMSLDQTLSGTILVDVGRTGGDAMEGGANADWAFAPPGRTPCGLGRPGHTRLTCTIIVRGDRRVESAETIELTLSSTRAGAHIGTQKTITVTIEDDDSAPRNLKVAAGNAKLDLSWTVPAGVTATGYDVHYTAAPRTGNGAVHNEAALGSNPATAWVDASHGGTTTSHAISGLTNETAYRVRVRVVTAGDNSLWVFGTGTPVLPPPRLTGLSLSADGNAVTPTPAFAGGTTSYTAIVVARDTSSLSVTPTWDESVLGVEAGSVRVSDSSVLTPPGGNSVPSSGGSATVALSFTGATRVAVALDRGSGTFRSTEYVITVDKIPSTVGGLEVVPGDGQLDLSWTAPVGTVTGYDVHFTSSTTVPADADAPPLGSGVNSPTTWAGTRRFEADPPAASQSITYLTNGTLYRVRVRAKNAAGAGDWVFGTGTPSGAPPPPPPPPPPGGATLSALALSAGALAFAPEITAYAVAVPHEVASVSVTPTASASGATVTVNGVEVASGEASAAIPLAVGETLIEVVVTAASGETGTYRVTVRIDDDAGGARAPELGFFPAASRTLGGMVRVINMSDEAGTVRVRAFDDVGEEHPAQTLTLGAGEATGFSPADLEEGNPDKGLTGTGPGAGDWRLVFESDLDLRVLGLARPPGGGLSPVHDPAPGSAEEGWHVAFFNPASNRGLRSRLRLANRSGSPAAVTITGIDADGRPGESVVTLRLPAQATCTPSAPVLESGAWGDTGPGAGCGALTGALGDGAGKWRLMVTSDQPLSVMSLLASATGRLTNLSSVPARAETGVRRLALLPPADDPLRQGFVRVINRDARAGTVRIRAFDDAGEEYPAQTLTLGAGEATGFSAADLEEGNPDRGLAGTGDGAGRWRLVLEPAPADLDLQALAYVRNRGSSSLAALHDTAPGSVEAGWEVAFFNPASNRGLLSRLRLVNRSGSPAAVRITGTDAAGQTGESAVTLTLPAQAACTLSAPVLESGAWGDTGPGPGCGALAGALGDGAGKWRLMVSSDQPLAVMSLLRHAASGALSNLSTARQ